MITIYLKQYNKIIRNADTGLFEELGYDDILWIDMLQPTIKEQKAVENFMEINLPDQAAGRRDRIDLEIFRNRECDHFERQLHVPTGESFVIWNPCRSSFRTKGVLVSVRRCESRTFQETEKRLQINYRNYQRAIIFSSRCSKCGSTTMLTWSS